MANWLWRHYSELDNARRQLGRYWDSLGWGPQETPSRIVLTQPGLTLKAYAREGAVVPLVVLLIPAPIKRAYLWDLAPEVSVVRRCLAGGMGVYLLQWEIPEEQGRCFGLADYADRMLEESLTAIQAETGQPAVVLAGHSLGGTLAAIFTALHPQRVKGLVLLGAPLHFGPEIGCFGPLVATAPHAHVLTAGLDNIPGSLLNSISVTASPGAFGWSRGWDWLSGALDPQASRLHGLVERWTLDEMPLPRRLFAELVEWLYREDRFLRQTLIIGEKAATPQHIHAPLLSVIDSQCVIAPPAAVLPFYENVPSVSKSLLWYPGEIGVALQHVGMLVGQQAHRQLWPAIIRWLHDTAG